MAAAVNYVEIPEPEYGLHRLPHLGDGVLQVLLPDEVKVLREEPCWQMETSRSIKTLVKYPDLRIMLVTMKPKTRIRRHRTNARLAVFALSGPHTRSLTSCNRGASASRTTGVRSEILAYQDYAAWAWTILPVSALIELTAVALFAINLIVTFIRPPVVVTSRLTMMTE